ncbi:hypothetical protein O181_042714 [Austropuccinia psidii MF-1]|uniref:Uncharacterized protein n=1 Tax=Austropuccinia psidii MF-1 TaxID=1389203 RepID=A0A9Q3DGM6_9BASI|nr:hypothetical protein [Austropuccinia psidii MF-1]
MDVMLLTAVGRKNNPPPPKQVPKTAPTASSSNFNMKKKLKAQKMGKGKAQPTKNLPPGLQNPKDSAGCHGKCISDGQNNDEITEKGGSQTKRSEMISEILDGIANFYIAINDLKSNISDENESICNNLKTDSLGWSQISETLMFF